MDEINSFLGLCKVKANEKKFSMFRVGTSGLYFRDLVHQIQQSLFIIQAELAGAPKTIPEIKVKNMETLVDAIESEMPPIKSFFISGGTELGAMFDVARTMARRAERRVVQAVEKKEVTISEHTKSYLNRLSSLLYALARLSNYRAGIKEEPPTYE